MIKRDWRLIWIQLEMCMLKGKTYICFEVQSSAPALFPAGLIPSQHRLGELLHTSNAYQPRTLECLVWGTPRNSQLLLCSKTSFSTQGVFKPHCFPEHCTRSAFWHFEFVHGHFCKSCLPLSQILRGEILGLRLSKSEHTVIFSCFYLRCCLLGLPLLHPQVALQLRLHGHV